MLRVSSLSVLLFASGCGSIPEGVFRCDRDAECPHGWFCRADRRCHSSPAGGIDAGGMDSGGSDAGASVDGGSLVDASIDSGTPTCPASCDDGNECSDDICGPGTNYLCSNQANTEICMNPADPCNHYQCFDYDCVTYVGPVVDNLIIDATRRCCGGVITNVSSNTQHCGMCNNQCQSSESCFGGSCT